jgi:hypothetical protein
VSMEELITTTAMLTPTEFAKDQFHRPPAWRYERARGILQQQVPRLAAGLEDPLVRSYVGFLRDEERLRRTSLREFDIGLRLASRWPLLYSAYEFKQQPAGALSRVSLEACVLAGMTDAEMAERFKRDVETVRVYRELFFDVADRLEVRDYIAGFVLAPVLQSGIESLNPELLAKYFGYFGGPAVLDRVLYGLNQQSGLSSDDEVMGYFENGIHSMIKYQTLVTVTLTQPSRFDVRTLVEGYHAIVQIERASQEGQPENTWVAGVTELLRQANTIPRSRDERIAFKRSVNSPEQAFIEAIPTVDGKVVSTGLPLEPRAEDRYALARGELSKAEMVEKLSKFTAPEPGGPQAGSFTDRK